MSEIRADLQDIHLPEPSAISLKAAYRLLRAMNTSPEPPTIDTLAVLLDSTLRYSDAIGYVSEAADYFKGDGGMVEAAQAFEEFVFWANS